MPIIETKQLTKVYPGGIKAVDQVDLNVSEGEIFGFLGPNGAGKTSTIMMLVTLSQPTAGKAWIDGHDIVKERNVVRQLFGYVSQDLAIDDQLTGWENLLLQGKLYHLSMTDIRKRGQEVLKMVDLWERRGDLVQNYSGGMRKRLDIACGLIHRPRILFLDEPTLGLDIQTRTRIWEYVRNLRDQFKMTIFITTHYMDEADKLCDRIAIIDRGTIKACESPLTLKHSVGGDLITIQFEENCQPEPALRSIQALPFVESVKSKGCQFIVVARDGDTAIPQIIAKINQAGSNVLSISLKRPSLDDAFLFYTGRELRDEEGGSQLDFARTRRTLRRSR